MQVVPESRLVAAKKIRAFEVPAEPVLMITPPSIFLLDERVFVSLGILKVAAMLESKGARVEHVDLSGIENFEDVAARAAASSAAKTICLTSTTPQLPAAVKVLAAIRAVRPDARVVLGGPHVTLVCAAAKLERKEGRVARGQRALEKLLGLFDVLVAGDGEFAVFEALRPDARGVIDGDDPAGGYFMTDADYDATPRIARHLVDLESYRYTIEGHRATSLIGQLGCPFACNFCGGRNSKALRVIRTRTVASIVAEVEHLYLAHGYTGFMFYDDELNVSRSMVELMRDLRALQDRLGVEFRLRGFVKSELFTDEQAEVMRAAGFRWLLCGFEGAHPEILRSIEKRATVEDNTRVMEIAARHDLKVKALMSVGHAGEREETIAAVQDWLLAMRPADFDVTVITTYPGTPYYDRAVPHESVPDAWTFTAPKTGQRLHSFDVDYTRVADYYKGDPDGQGYAAYVFTDYLSGAEIVRLRDGVERDVRAKLGIPFNPGKPAVRYEHSMGMSEMPEFILRGTPR